MPVYSCVLLSAHLALAEQPAGVPPGTVGWQASGRGGAVVAGGAEAVEAGFEVRRGGCNAADAAVATLLALSVTDSRSFCFGGEVPVLVYDARRRVVEVVCGQGAAPRLASREHFAARGGIPGRGVEAAAVRGAQGACLTTLDRLKGRRHGITSRSATWKRGRSCRRSPTVRSGR